TLLPFRFLISSICVSIVLTSFTNERNSLVSSSVKLRDSVPKPSLLTLALISSILSNKLLRCSFNSLIVAIKYYLHVIQPFCVPRSEEHTSELQSRFDLVCRLLLEKKKLKDITLVV